MDYLRNAFHARCIIFVALSRVGIVLCCNLSSLLFQRNALAHTHIDNLSVGHGKSQRFLGVYGCALHKRMINRLVWRFVLFVALSIESTIVCGEIWWQQNIYIQSFKNNAFVALLSPGFNVPETMTNRFRCCLMFAAAAAAATQHSHTMEWPK